ncbi:MAG: mannose-6-phosphate isomerase [Pirellulaceae bacterium]|nr:MAG: mannose-6-phosphate isomerase [Pirellulaceae bacterium]
MEPLYPLRFEPLFKQYLWGGRRLETVLGKKLGPGEHYAESWEVVDHGQDQSVVANGPLRGKTLGEIRSWSPQALLGRHADQDRFPLLFKFLDAQQNLSVQVHPDDQAAARLDPPDRGKTEAWVILDAAPGSRIYAGLRPGCTEPLLRQALAEGRLLEWLHSFQPQKGDCVFIPAGTVHALGAGLLVAEIQQSSDTTFRLYDWDRVGPDGQPRPLHIDQALAVIDFSRGPVEPVRPQPATRQTLVSCPYFVLEQWQLHPETVPQVTWGGDDRFHILSVIAGELEVDHPYVASPLSLGQTVLVPAACRLTLTARQPATVLDMYLP